MKPVIIGDATLYVGDCVAVMRALPDNSVDSIVTDPPYEIGFMSKKWDNTGIANSVPMWTEAMRVLKPGGHLLAFSGSRTYHRMTCAIEDAGFEVRDQIMWLYGSGFPKSMNVSKAIDRAAGAEREVVGVKPSNRPNMVGAEPGGSMGGGAYTERLETAPSTDAARQWDGWGTALKPAHEPICVARKPLIGTVATNVLAHGTGALNIDGCRVGVDSVKTRINTAIQGGKFASGDGRGLSQEVTGHSGRWPANIIHDGSAEVVAMFPANAGAAAPVSGKEKSAASTGNVTGKRERIAGAFHADTGSAARFFYCTKTSSKDRHEGLDAPGHKYKHGVTLRQVENIAATGERKGNIHPTVKPTDLMAYLCRLVTPPGGLILDPFMGSGSTGKAAMREGFRFIGIDMSAEYVAIAAARIEQACEQGQLFAPEPMEQIQESFI